jgi:hypothetical protein
LPPAFGRTEIPNSKFQGKGKTANEKLKNDYVQGVLFFLFLSSVSLEFGIWYLEFSYSAGSIVAHMLPREFSSSGSAPKA